MKADRIVWGAFWALFFFSALNIMIMNQLGGGDQEQSSDLQMTSVVVHDVQQEEKPAKATTQRRELIPVDPADYGIVAIPKAKLPRSQIEWEVQMSHLLEDSKILEKEEGKEAIRKMETSAQKFADTDAKVDKEIATLEEQFQDEPFNAGLENRLQTLYKLKAVGNIMKDHVTTLDQNEYKKVRDGYNLPPE